MQPVNKNLSFKHLGNLVHLHLANRTLNLPSFLHSVSRQFSTTIATNGFVHTRQNDANGHVHSANNTRGRTLFFFFCWCNGRVLVRWQWTPHILSGFFGHYNNISCSSFLCKMNNTRSSFFGRGHSVASAEQSEQPSPSHPLLIFTFLANKKWRGFTRF